MKHEKQTGALHHLRGMFARNFGLKLLSLTLAVLIYISLKPDDPRSAQSSTPTVLRTVTETIERHRLMPSRTEKIPPPAPAASEAPSRQDATTATNETNKVTQPSTSSKKNGSPKNVQS